MPRYIALFRIGDLRLCAMAEHIERKRHVRRRLTNGSRERAAQTLGNMSVAVQSGDALLEYLREIRTYDYLCVVCSHLNNLWPAASTRQLRKGHDVCFSRTRGKRAVKEGL